MELTDQEKRLILQIRRLKKADPTARQFCESLLEAVENSVDYFESLNAEKAAARGKIIRFADIQAAAPADPSLQ